jgi:hypothetical protein
LFLDLLGSELSAVSYAFLVRKSPIAAKRLKLANHFDN